MKKYKVEAVSLTLSSGTYQKGAVVPEHKIKHLDELLKDKSISLIVEAAKPAKSTQSKPND